MSKVNWFYEIGQEIKDDKRDLVIIDREVRPTEEKNKGKIRIINRKWYRYKCLKCDDKHWIVESSLKLGRGCKECANENKKGLRKDFNYNIGDIVGDLVITWREHTNIYETKSKRNRIYYGYKCLKCGYENKIREDHLNEGVGCSCCDNKIAVLGINTILDTDHWMIDLGVSIEDAKKYTSYSKKKITVICPDCGEEKTITISDIYINHSISCSCGDGVSYPEKFMISLLKQLDIKFIKEYTSNWSNNKRYDFYLEDYNIIIETHGEQHYKESNSFMTNLKEQQENDKYKKELAFNNGIDKYIVIDCSKSELEFIKQNILNSELNYLFDLSKIDWLKCEEYALKNIIKEICECYNNNLNIIDIVNKYNLCRCTIRKYLKKGAKLGWCNYDAKKQMKISAKRSSDKRKVPIKIFENDIYLGIFESTHELDRQSNNLFKEHLDYRNIHYCIKNNKLYKGYKFEKATKEEYEEAVKNNTINKRIDNIELEQVS